MDVKWFDAVTDDVCKFDMKTKTISNLFTMELNNSQKYIVHNYCRNVISFDSVAEKYAPSDYNKRARDKHQISRVMEPLKLMVISQKASISESFWLL